MSTYTKKNESSFSNGNQKSMSFDVANEISKLNIIVGGLPFTDPKTWETIPELEALADKYNRAEESFGILAFTKDNICDSCTRRNVCVFCMGKDSNGICKKCAYYEMEAISVEVEEKV